MFVDDYDIAVARALYQGCDVWLNNPRRPQEACGTSGMKAALNGGLNLSILDGWWDEMFDGENGWAISSAEDVEDLERRDRLEAGALFDLLERPGGAAVLRALRAGRCRAAGSRRCGVAVLAGPAVTVTHGGRLRGGAVRGTDGRPDRPALGRRAARAKALAAWKERVRAAWHGVHVDPVEVTILRRRPRRSRAWWRRWWRWATCPPRTWTSSWCTARWGQGGELTECTTVSMAPDGNSDDDHAHYVGACSPTTPGATASPSGSCPGTPTWSARPSSASPPGRNPRGFRAHIPCVCPRRIRHGHTHGGEMSGLRPRCRPRHHIHGAAAWRDGRAQVVVAGEQGAEIPSVVSLCPAASG